MYVYVPLNTRKNRRTGQETPGRTRTMHNKTFVCRICIPFPLLLPKRRTLQNLLSFFLSFLPPCYILREKPKGPLQDFFIKQKLP